MASLNVSISPGRRFFPSLNIAGWRNPSPPKARAQQGRFKHPCRTSQLARRAGKGSARVSVCVVKHLLRDWKKIRTRWILFWCGESSRAGI